MGNFNNLYESLKNKKVMISLKEFYASVRRTYEGKIIGMYLGEGGESFFELDTGSFINTRYIESIEVTD